jgi:hypothetical protein
MNEPEIGLMNEGRMLERMAFVFGAHLTPREPPQLIVDVRKQLVHGVRIAVAPLV